MARLLKQLRREEKERTRQLRREGVLPRQLHVRAIDRTRKIVAPPLKWGGDVLSGLYRTGASAINLGKSVIQHRYTKRLALSGLAGMFLAGAAVVGDHYTYLGQNALGHFAKGRDFSSFYETATPGSVADSLMEKHSLLHGTTPEKIFPFDEEKKCELAFYDEEGNGLECTDSYMTFNQIVNKFGMDFFEGWVAVEDRNFFEHHGIETLYSAKGLFERVATEVGFMDGYGGGSTLTETYIGQARGESVHSSVFRKGIEKIDATGLERKIRDEIHDQINRRQTGEQNPRRDYLEDIFTSDELLTIEAGLTEKEEKDFAQQGAKRKILEELFNLPVLSYGDDPDKAWKDPDLGHFNSYGEAFEVFLPGLYGEDVKVTEELELKREVAMAYFSGGLKQPGRHFQAAKNYVKMKRDGFDFEALKEKIEEEGSQNLSGEEKLAFRRQRAFERTVGRTLDTLDAKYKVGYSTEDIGDKVDVAETLESLLTDALAHEKKNGTVPHWYLQQVRVELKEKYGLSGDQLRGLKIIVGYDQDATEKIQREITRVAMLPRYKREGVHLAATLIDGEGVGRVVIGDTKYHPVNSAFNHASTSIPVGSTHKPFLGLHALESGIIIPGRTMLYGRNSIVSHGGRPVRNAGIGNTEGALSGHSPAAVLKDSVPFLRPTEWLQASYNVPTIAELRNLPGYGDFLDELFGNGTITWTAAGKKHDQVALGIMEAPLIDITRAHTLFLEGKAKHAGEVLPEARFVLAIYGARGNLLYEDKLVDPVKVEYLQGEIESRENADELTQFLSRLTPVAIVRNLENLDTVRQYMRHAFLPPNGTARNGAQTYQSHFIAKTGTSNLSEVALAVVSSPDHQNDHYSLGVVLYDERGPSPTASPREKWRYAEYSGMVSGHAAEIGARALARIDGAGKRSRTTEYAEIVRNAETTLEFATYLEQELTSGFRVHNFGLDDEVQHFEDVKPRHKKFFDLTEGYPQVVVAESYEMWNEWMENSNYLRIESSADITEVDDVWGLVEKVNISHPELAKMEVDLFYATRAGIPGADELYQRTRDLSRKLDEQVIVTDSKTSPRTTSFGSGHQDIIYVK
jgi:membrane peptidoglycan carboxypeptidase